MNLKATFVVTTVKSRDVADCSKTRLQQQHGKS